MAVFEMVSNTTPESLLYGVSYYFTDSIKYTVENLLKRSTWQNVLTAVLSSPFIQKGLMRECIMCGEWERSNDWLASASELHLRVPAFFVLRFTLTGCITLLRTPLTFR